MPVSTAAWMICEIGPSAVGWSNARWAGITALKGTVTPSRVTPPLAVVRCPKPSQLSITVRPGALRSTKPMNAWPFSLLPDRGHDMGEQCAGAVELFTVDLRAITVKPDLGVKGAGVFALGLGESIAEAVARQHLAEVIALLLLGGGLQEDVDDTQMVLRDLPRRTGLPRRSI